MVNHNDPVEAAKRGGKKPTSQEEQSGVKVHEPPLEPQAPPQPKSDSGYYVAPVAENKPLPQAPPANPIRPEPAEQPALICMRYRITHDWRGSLFGQMIHMKAGEIIDKGHYGEDGFRRLIDGGLRVEPA